MARHTSIFFALSLALSWLVAGLFHLTGGSSAVPTFMLVAIVFRAMPAFAAVATQELFVRTDTASALGLKLTANVWTLAAYVVPIGLAIGVLAVTAFVPGVSLDFNPLSQFERQVATMTPEQVSAMQAAIDQGRIDARAASPIGLFLMHVSQLGLWGIAIGSVVHFAEEIGMRGFVVSQLRGLGFWRLAFLQGVMSGLWTMPLVLLGVLYPQHRDAGVFLLSVQAVLLAPVLLLVRVKAKSVVASSVARGGLELTAALSVAYAVGGDDLTTGLTGLPGFLVLAALNVVIALKFAKGADEALRTNDL